MPVISTIMTPGVTDSMAQWQDYGPECWEAWGLEFNSMLGRVGVRFQCELGRPPENIHFLLFYFLLPNLYRQRLLVKSYMCIT